MHSFVPEFLEAQPVSQELVGIVRAIGEHKGRQELFRNQVPQVLERMRAQALIRSTESSNRIEGISAPTRVVERIVRGRLEPKNRSEREIAGYRDVLDHIHTAWADMPFTTGLVLQLHRDLLRYVPSEGGVWKNADNTITETLVDGTERVRFVPVPAFQTPEAMAALHERFARVWDAGRIDRLLLIPAYLLDFLCIHPFRDGNGRMARLLCLLLLYKAGYEVGRYVSLEEIVERTKEGYYRSLHAASQGWHDGAHALAPVWDYFLGVMLETAYRQFEERVGDLQARRGAKREMILAAIDNLPETFRYRDITDACPGVSRPTISRVLAELHHRGAIRLAARGRAALWEKVSD